ncbi:hypothetical protein EN01_020590 [Vibrio parahaemolyticus]|nr:hypothetical protein BBM91_20210 [Vibrio parahaemolyticus]OQU13719.1 hypothetical protein EN01_020590 [Vibrio parahaemolyticus]POC22740.1 hypothetical protein CRN46_11455 [Vibrio vulnificus]
MTLSIDYLAVHSLALVRRQSQNRRIEPLVAIFCNERKFLGDFPSYQFTSDDATFLINELCKAKG